MRSKCEEKRLGKGSFRANALDGPSKKSLLIPYHPPSLFLSPSHPKISQRQAMNQCGQIMEADQQIPRAQDRKIQIVNKFEKPKYQNVLDFLEYLEDR